MSNCPLCSSPVAAGQRYCPSCGAPLSGPSGAASSAADAEVTIDAPPVASRSPSSPSSSVATGEVLAPGQLLLGRYRIVSFLGRGGMGVVYRADDLKLGQPVALKLLSAELSADETWLQRLYQEVRVARQVSHPNVCRVYDIGEVEGRHFISMEYVEGEDLASLLRRIGRLPNDKAEQIARQLCAGVAAAHDRGVIHRDLKPGNVMLDGEGNVRVADFGLAVATEEAEERRDLSGTPAYMAPEQLSRGEASVQSDLFALGLVIYEVFTGKKAYESSSPAELSRLHADSAPRSPSSIVDGLDPAIEAVIMRCLERDPANRPPSALAVAAALPGGDPLAAALAAGTTPSPELVAASGSVGALRPWVAVALLAAVAVLAGVGTVILSSASLLTKVPPVKAPAVLEERAGQLIERLGLVVEADDSAGWFTSNQVYLDHLAENDDSPQRWHKLAAGPPALLYIHRTSPRPLVPRSPGPALSRSDPPPLVPGMATLILDGGGRLVELRVVPPAMTEGETVAAGGVDWGPLLEEAGLALSELTPAMPRWTPPVACDTRAAWEGRWSDGTPLRVEAAAFHGSPVFLKLVGEWTKPPGGAGGGGASTIEIVLVLFILSLIAVAAVLARRNLRAGRGDRHGAMRLAVFIFVMTVASALLRAHHVGSISELAALIDAFMVAAANAVITWLLYAAIEPYARRFLPHTMISWSRVVGGRVRDPMVGRDLLVGSAVGALMGVMYGLSHVLPPLLDRPGRVPHVPNLVSLLGGGRLAAVVLPTTSDIAAGLGFFLILLLARIALRRQWLAVAAANLVLILFSTQAFTRPLAEALLGAVMVVALLAVLVRFGLLAMLVVAVETTWLFASPSTLDLGAWYAWAGLLGPILVLAVAFFGFRIARDGRPVLSQQ